MLILAVVAIRAVSNDGIISHAKNAATGYDKAQTEEQNKLSGYELILAQETGNAWKQNKTKVTKGNITLEVGDTVNYDETKGGTVTVPVNVEWKVLGEENGQILLMSTADVGTVSLSGAADYYNDVGIGKINAACSAYGQGNGAAGVRSIKVEDIDKLTGFVKEDYGKGQVNGYGNKVTYTLEADGDTLTHTVEGKPKLNVSMKLSEGPCVFIKPDGTNLKAGESYVADQNTYYYEGNTYLDTKSEAYKMLFRNSANTSNVYYWLGSSYAGADTSIARFGVRRVNYGYVDYCSLWASNYGESSYSYGVRAVVSLKSDVELTPSGENSWTLSLK